MLVGEPEYQPWLCDGIEEMVAPIWLFSPRLPSPRKLHRLPLIAAGWRPTYRDSHGLISFTPLRSKSLTLRVAIAAPVEKAMAAICASNCEMGRPERWRIAAIFAY